MTTLLERIAETTKLQLTEDELIIELAIALFQQEKITLGTGALLAGMNQLQFQQLLGSRGISPHYDEEDFKHDIQSLKANNWL